MKKRKRGFRIKKKSIQIIIALAILIIGIYAIYATVDYNKAWHSPSEIILTIGDCDVTLQDAIDNNYLDGTVTPTICLLQSDFPDAYHLASEIIITINGFDVTLQDALDRNYFIGETISSSSTSLPSTGHLAEDIEVSVEDEEMSLQDAITNNELVPPCEPDCSCASSTPIGQTCIDPICGETCEGTQSCIPDCSCAAYFCEGQTCIDPICGTTCDGTQLPIAGGWTAWSACSAICNGGIQTRTCTNPYSSCGGAACVGDSSQVCNTAQCYKVTARGCVGYGSLTTSSTCLTFMCDAYREGKRVYARCSGYTCYSWTPETCPNTIYY